MADHQEYERERNRDKTPDDSAEAGAETLAAINTLMHEEALLAAQADHLREEAQKLEAMGDDDAKATAGQMVRQAENISTVAKEVGQTIKEMQSDPQKKGARRKRDSLLVRSSTILEASEQEEGEAAGAHDHLAEHKAATREMLHKTEKHAVEKPASTPKAKKSIAKPAVHAASVHEEAPKKKNEHRVRRYWHAAKEKAEEAYEFVSTKTIIAIGFAKNAWHTAGEWCEEGWEAATHPVTTVKKLAAHVTEATVSMTSKISTGTRKLLSRASDAMANLWPFGDDDKDEAPLVVVPPPKPPLKKEAAHAAKKVIFPAGLKADTHAEMLGPFIPDSTPAMQPFGPLLSFS